MQPEERGVRWDVVRIGGWGQSHFGNVVYEWTVAQDHLLRQMDAVVDWKAFTDLLNRCHQGAREVGRPPNHR